mmetsp:Transcript_40919/g.97970  ORF Transcript_40919/g.97970 Transcript_40919/m.97970 type:complete len:248 (-) Transcript_40919:269-1012(-)
MYHRIWKCAVRSEKIFLFFFFKLYIYTNALYYTYIQIKSFFCFLVLEQTSTHFLLFSSHQTIERKSSNSILHQRPFIYLSVASVSYVPSRVYESAIDCDSMSDCRKISLNASGCLTPKKRIPKIRNNVREPMMIPQTPMANRNREMIKSTMYRPRNVKSDSPILEFSKRETTGVGASMATHIMTRQTTVMIDPTRTSRYRARKMKLIETAIFKAYSKAERVRKDRVRRCFEDMLLFCSIFVVIEIAV